MLALNLLCWGIGINYSCEQLAHQKADEADVGAGSLAAPVGFVQLEEAECEDGESEYQLPTIH